MSEIDHSKIENMFESFDTSQKGELGHYEIKNFLRKISIDLQEDVKALTGDNTVNQLYDLFDINKDGKIDIHEFTDLVKFLIYEKGYIID